jgi:hypothetical protein
VVFYKNKEKPWKSIYTHTHKYEKPFFFYVKRVPMNKWLLPPRVFLMINLFLISIWRDNTKFYLGIGFGKTHWTLEFAL